MKIVKTNCNAKYLPDSVCYLMTNMYARRVNLVVIQTDIGIDGDAASGGGTTS